MDGPRSPARGRRPRAGSPGDDALTPRIARAVQEILRDTDEVSPIEVVQRMGLLTREHLADWRRGKVPYLERVVQGNLMRLSRLLRLLHQHAHDLKLAPSLTVYVRHGGNREKLRFTKSGDPSVERAWSTHLIAPGRLAERLLYEWNRPPAVEESGSSPANETPRQKESRLPRPPVTG